MAEAGAHSIGIKVVSQAGDGRDEKEQAYVRAEWNQKSPTKWPLHGYGLQGLVRDWGT